MQPAIQLKPSKDAAFLNQVVNHPEVAKWMCGYSPPFDLTETLQLDSTVFLANQYGGFLFVYDNGHPGCYEVHTQFLPEGRGRALELAKQAAWYMFTKTDAIAISTYVPASNEAAYRLTLSMGFVRYGIKVVNFEECDMFMLSIKDWARNLCQPQQ